MINLIDAIALTHPYEVPTIIICALTLMGLFGVVLIATGEIIASIRWKRFMKKNGYHNE